MQATLLGSVVSAAGAEPLGLADGMVLLEVSGDSALLRAPWTADGLR